MICRSAWLKHYPWYLELNSLRHLRELRADGNRIASLNGIANLDSLLKLSVQGNELREVDFAEFRWYVNDWTTATIELPLRRYPVWNEKMLT